ncbi:MAG: hypothetical protein [Olavius algarvensis Delta 4 endosymbiont]|nr:MAG: hypothetical protein [Olavius algarvensis Delta 4 endosymbiont]
MPKHLEHQKTKFTQNADIVRRAIADEIILVPIRGELADMQRLFALDETSDFIWQRLDGNRTVGEIHSAILNHFDVAADQAAMDLNDFIQALLEADLIHEVA